MYFQIILKWLNKTRKITLPQFNDTQSLIILIKQLFRFKDEQIIGVTDRNGKFYDVSYLASNLKLFNNMSLQLSTSTVFYEQNELLPQLVDQNQINIQPISFASNTPNQFENDYNPLNEDSVLEEYFQIPEQPQSLVLGQIHNLKLFQQTILDDDLTIVVESNKNIDKLKFPYYHLKGKQRRIHVYRSQKKICQIPIFNQNLKSTQNIILNIINSFSQSYDMQKYFETHSNQKSPYIGEPEESTKQDRFMEVNSYQQNFMSQQEQRHLFLKQNKQQRGCNFLCKKQSQSQRSQQQQRYSIPIIIRKNNNKIQKVTTSYPLSQQQMQAINSLLQLQIQGLFTDQQINKVKMMIFGQNSQVLQIFCAYSNKKFNVKDLCKNLTLALKTKQPMKK